MNNSCSAPPFQLDQVKAEKARRNFKEFVIQSWPVVEPSTRFVDGLHVDAICSHLQAVAEGRTANLLINVPPGHAKSLLVCVLWPAWVWIGHPEKRWLFASYREELAIRDSLKCRRLIESDWYQRHWGHVFQLRKDQNQKHRFENDRSGYRVVVPMSAGTGERGDYVVIDDPHSVDQAESDSERTRGVEWWNGSMSTRLNDPSNGHLVVVQQRLHESDLTGDLLQRGGYEHWCLPAEFEPERRCSTSIGWQDPRTERGELLWPQRFDRAVLDRIQIALGSYRYAGQFQQRPAPADGGVLKRPWWNYWQPPGANLPPVAVKLANGSVEHRKAVELPAHFDQELQTWDMSCKDTQNSDFVVGLVMAALGADRFVVDRVRGRMDLPATLRAIRDLTRRYPRAELKLVEDKANGPAVIQSLKHEIRGLVAVNPEGGKMARVMGASPLVEAGNCYLPHPQLYSWVEEFIAECAAFPAGAYDDQVDAFSQGANRLLPHRPKQVRRPSYFPEQYRGARAWMI